MASRSSILQQQQSKGGGVICSVPHTPIVHFLQSYDPECKRGIFLHIQGRKPSVRVSSTFEYSKGAAPILLYTKTKETTETCRLHPLHDLTYLLGPSWKLTGFSPFYCHNSPRTGSAQNMADQ